MDPNSRSFLIQRQRELSEILQSLQIQSLEVKGKVDVISSKIKPLESVLQHLTEEIYELKRALENENETLKEQSLKLAKTRWVHTTTELAANTEKATMEIYFKIMNSHEEKSLIASSNILKEPFETLSMDDDHNDKENKTCVESAKMMELEDLAAHLCNNRLKNQEKLSDAKKHNCILHKRNAATLLRMRKNLLECEGLRKKLVDKKSEIFKTT